MALPTEQQQHPQSVSDGVPFQNITLMLPPSCLPRRGVGATKIWEGVVCAAPHSPYGLGRKVKLLVEKVVITTYLGCSPDQYNYIKK